MPVDGKYSDSVRQINDADRQKFKDSQEAAFRRLVRATIRKGPFTKSERDVILAFVNHWFAHRAKGAVHPGRKKLAKRADVAVITVKRTLAKMRDAGVINAEAHLHGLRGKATEYTVDTVALFAFCGSKIPGDFVNGGSNEPTRGWVKMSHRINNIITFPSQELGG